MSETPRTDAEIDDVMPNLVGADFARQLERELNESHERILQLISERDRARFLADQKIALRKELEEIVGIPNNEFDEAKFKKAIKRLGNLKEERDQWMAVAERMEPWCNDNHAVAEFRKLKEASHD